MQVVMSKVLFAVCFATAVLSAAEPTVTLSHGGKLRGVSTTFTDKPVDLFLGVRYAQPPTGDLRFKKPEEMPSWEGTVDATTVGNMCPQTEPDGSETFSTKYIGNEDCLFLDITVPGGTTPRAKKPVMVWIHGGGYLFGSGISYLAAALAMHGDVIIVSINYRLGVLGFFSLGKGTGNFGLWDQRAALVWVQKNIEAFGGDPELVTIFGESAGGGSVLAQTIGQHNDGLFKRAIAQSATGYAMFDLSENMKHKLASSFREQTNCDSDVSVYDCLKDMTAEEIVIKLQLPIWRYMFPTVDGDFFLDEEAAERTDKLSHRYELMAGMNGGEGGIMFVFDFMLFAKSQNSSDVNEFGVSMELTQKFLEHICATQLTPMSPNLCTSFLISLYKLDEATDDKDRAARLLVLLGDEYFNVDTANMLEQHSSGDKSTYAYYFTELYKPLIPNPLWTIPEWLKTTADHGAEITFVFGESFYKSEMEKDGIWKKIASVDTIMEGFISGALSESRQPLSLLVMTMWTNFAKSGNPNEPEAINAPLWPEFDLESNSFMEINGAGCKVIPTPNRERLTKFRNNIYQARRLQIAADQVPAPADSIKSQGSKRDEL